MYARPESGFYKKLLWENTRKAGGPYKEKGRTGRRSHILWAVRGPAGRRVLETRLPVVYFYANTRYDGFVV